MVETPDARVVAGLACIFQEVALHNALLFLLDHPALRRRRTSEGTTAGLSPAGLPPRVAASKHNANFTTLAPIALEHLACGATGWNGA
eukprot:scaffold282124_cov33-Tisochrysis_lutea.AAC.4